MICVLVALVPMACFAPRTQLPCAMGFWPSFSQAGSRRHSEQRQPSLCGTTRNRGQALLFTRADS